MLREIVQWPIWKLRVVEWLVRAVMALYAESRTSVRVNGVESDEFDGRIRVHQECALNSLLFIKVLVLSQE